MTKYITQSAVLPFRKHKGTIEVMLVTSRNTKRWVLPKGHVEKNLTPYRSAEKEAYEEAGVKGQVSTKRLGSYRYIKPELTGINICKVDVYPMEVSKELDNWPERKQRTRQWTPIEEAANLIAEKKLGKLMKKFATELSA